MKLYHNPGAMRIFLRALTTLILFLFFCSCLSNTKATTARKASPLKHSATQVRKIASTCPSGYDVCGENNQLCCPVPVSDSCPAGQVPCGKQGFCCGCEDSFTIADGKVNCTVHRVTNSTLCVVSGFSDITAEFRAHPSQQQLDTAFTGKCADKRECAEKFKCKYSGCPIGYIRCGASGELCC